jgi:hypothetical protein
MKLATDLERMVHDEMRPSMGGDRIVWHHRPSRRKPTWRIASGRHGASPVASLSDAVYGYLGAVFKIVRRWRKERRAKGRSHQALRAKVTSAIPPKPHWVRDICRDGPEVEVQIRRFALGRPSVIRFLPQWLSRCPRE